MGQQENNMKENAEELLTLKEYLLGTLNDESKTRQIEEKLLLDDSFAEQLSMAEYNLIEDFLDDNLNKTQREYFINIFLSVSQRRRQLRLIKNVRKYAAEKEQRVDRHPFKDNVNSLGWKAFFSSPVLRFTLIILVILGLGFSTWRVFFYESEADKGLAQLRLAYRGQRPIEPRTTANFEYAPVQNIRGEASPVFDEKALTRAERLLFFPTDAKSHHALGLLYLVERQFDKAQEEFNLALGSDTHNAALYSDIGALYLEKAKQAKIEKKQDESFSNFALSLKYIQLALDIDNSLLEALFNRALVFQEMKLTLQAQEAWQKYLDKDSATQWADEARKNLELLKSNESKNKTADEILRDFLASYNAKDDEKAYQIVSRNREMITGKMVPQQLILLFLTGPDENKKTYLKALQYVGRLEKERTNDSFFYEIAGFYSQVSAEKLEVLKNAYFAIQEGYDLLQSRKNKEALEKFSLGRALFEQAGDQWEVRLTDYWIAYCDNALDHIQESTGRLLEVAGFSRGKNYKWLSAQVFYWLSVNANSTKETSKSINYGELSLRFSEETFDFYQINKTYSFLAESYINVKQYSPALTNMAKVMLVVDDPDYSQRQKWRDFDRIAKLFFGMELYDAAAAFETEALSLNQNQTKKESTFERISLAYLGRIYGAQKKYEEAADFTERSREASEKLTDPEDRLKGIGFALLQAAALEFERGNLQESLANYEKVIDIYHSMEYKLYQYEAEKGRLLCYLARKDDEAVRRTLPEVLQAFEKNREKILEEQSRDTFFDDEQNIYDLAIDYEYSKGNYEQAFQYAEDSRSRSLLDWQKNPGKPVLDNGIPQTVFNENTVSQPLSLADIRLRLPEKAQLVYYAVLPNKVLIWLITKDKFGTLSYSISNEDLNDKVISLNSAIRKQDVDGQTQLSHILYRILIDPVEDQLDPDKDIFLIPDKILCHLPFVALISDKTNNYLVADYRFTFSPSASVFVESSDNAEKRKQAGGEEEKLLSIGDPDFDKEEFPGLQSLPAAEDEARKISSLYTEPNVLSGPSATKQNIKEGIAKADVVQFAGHYVVNGQSYLRSSFAVSGIKEESRWANYEILQEDLKRPRLIVLAACETGIEHYYSGEGMIGAGRTFLSLGVPLVVASQWKVETKATAELMIKFHRLRKKEGLSTSAALQHAQLEMLNNSYPLFRQPFYWAGFFTLGGYAQF
jgi:CHAT domain-containing protein